MTTLKDLREFFPYLFMDTMDYFKFWYQENWSSSFFRYEELTSPSTKHLCFAGHHIFVVKTAGSSLITGYPDYHKYPYTMVVIPKGMWKYVDTYLYDDGQLVLDGYIKLFEDGDWIMRFLRAMNVLQHCKYVDYPECLVYLAPKSFYPGNGRNALLNRAIGGVDRFNVSYDNIVSYDECREYINYYEDMIKEIEEFYASEDLCK